MIIGTGIDIVKIPRFEKATPRFMERVFTIREREYLAGKSTQSIAGMFAAKEAVVKALGTGFTGFSPCDIEILHTKQGKPYVKLHRHKSGSMQPVNVNIHVSISHTKTDAIAFAIIEKSCKGSGQDIHRFFKHLYRRFFA